MCDVKDEKGIVPDWAYVAPGEGDFDYVNYLKLMNENNYDGFITVEISFQLFRFKNGNIIMLIGTYK